jgi:GH24 family phage-related lysozyme (muramidase)
MRALFVLLLLILSGYASAQSRAVVSPAGEKFIARWEVGGPELYTRRYQMPIWPGNSASGVTIGIGYDLGHNSVERILADWHMHPHRGYLAAMSGFKGQSAGNLAKRRAWIITPLPMAMQVFRDPTLIRYYNIARRSFPGLQDQDQAVIDMILDLVYNRGGNMVGKDRLEMRHIRDVCFPARDHACTANQIRKMERIWRGSKLGKGLIARRNQEADYIMIRARA